MKIEQYKIVESHDSYTLENKVNELLTEGWQPYRGLRVAIPVEDGQLEARYTQIMVKYKD
ncbi:MAG: DUF1737 domain-containing protein [Desulfuromonadales bacterium]|nr:DUF1737 domain-containing protein [Desulfuromonadales bacterium]